MGSLGDNDEEEAEKQSSAREPKLHQGGTAAGHRQDKDAKPLVGIAELAPGLRADEIIGAEVRSSDDRIVGEVRNIVFRNEGSAGLRDRGFGRIFHDGQRQSRRADPVSEGFPGAHQLFSSSARCEGQGSASHARSGLQMARRRIVARQKRCVVCKVNRKSPIVYAKSSSTGTIGLREQISITV